MKSPLAQGPSEGPAPARPAEAIPGRVGPGPLRPRRGDALRRLGPRLREALAAWIAPSPVAARHAVRTFAYSADDDASGPSDRLLEAALAAVQHARSLRLAHLADRLPGPPRYPEVWPGEHYRLLAGLALATRPRVVVEIGTGSGLSALALKEHLPADGLVATFDLVPWTRYPGGVLRREDFADGRLVQHLDDLASPAAAARHRDLLESADLLFVDAAKDGATERALLRGFEDVAFRRNPLVAFDDIRFPAMLPIWRSIRRPKLDLTSFGHWSGTGLVDWSARAGANGS